MRRIEPYFLLSHGVPRVRRRTTARPRRFTTGSSAEAGWGCSKTNRKIPIPYDRTLYRQRHRIENMFGRLKDRRRIHTRYDRCAHTFMSAICIAATVITRLNQ